MSNAINKKNIFYNDFKPDFLNTDKRISRIKKIYIKTK